jgi:hypothetical protein
MPAGRFTLEFYQSPDGDEPARRWMEKRLSASQRRALDAALRLILAEHGVGVCGSPYGRHVGRGLFEFRLDEDEATLLHKWSPAGRRRALPRRETGSCCASSATPTVTASFSCSAATTKALTPAAAGNSARSPVRVYDSPTS